MLTVVCVQTHSDYCIYHQVSEVQARTSVYSCLDPSVSPQGYQCQSAVSKSLPTGKLATQLSALAVYSGGRQNSSYDFPGGTSGKEPACQCRRHKRLRFSPWARKIPWSRKCHPTPVFLHGESHGQGSLVGYCP